MLDMTDTDRGQVSAAAAEVYEGFFVPALFDQWTGPVLDAAGVAPRQRVLDVGCGTGVLARAAARRVGPGGSVTGLDPNTGMLAVARALERAVRWEHGVAEQLPFPDAAFDRTVSQFALMFCTDPPAAVAEMARVTAPGGRVAVAVWDGLENNHGYARLADLLGELFGPDARSALEAPFVLGNAPTLARLGASLRDAEVAAVGGVARFASLEAWMHTEIRGWTLADAIDDEGYDRLLERARRELADLVDVDGVAFEVSALVLAGDV
jgi:SAM-dependent methyltransferase